VQSLSITDESRRPSLYCQVMHCNVAMKQISEFLSGGFGKIQIRFSSLAMIVERSLSVYKTVRSDKLRALTRVVLSTQKTLEVYF